MRATATTTAPAIPTAAPNTVAPFMTRVTAAVILAVLSRKLVYVLKQYETRFLSASPAQLPSAVPMIFVSRSKAVVSLLENSVKPWSRSNNGAGLSAAGFVVDLACIRFSVQGFQALHLNPKP